MGDHHGPERRTLLQIGLEDAAIADEIFTILMGENVEPPQLHPAQRQGRPSWTSGLNMAQALAQALGEPEQAPHMDRAHSGRCQAHGRTGKDHMPDARRIEPIEIEEEMQRSFLDYAMSVIVARALPDVRDGLKPVHRRILWGANEEGVRPPNGRRKSAYIVGSVLGKYHPHSDTAVYDAMVRLGQDFASRYPLIDGQGNFGTADEDEPAAMRYCVTGDTLVATTDGTLRIDQIHPDVQPNSDTDIDLKVLDRLGNPVRASKLFHSGSHPTLRLRTTSGYEITGTHNHPLLCLASVAGVPMLLWASR